MANAAASPRVSVVIPTYRHRDFVMATLESVWAQTFTDYEVIVVNDGSPDDTDALLTPAADAGRIRYIVQPNGGQANARNRGLREARGEFIALLDDDDLWVIDKLQVQVDALDANPNVAVVYGRAAPIDNAGYDTIPLGENGEPLVLPWETPTGNVYESFARQNWILSPGQCLIRRSALDALPDPAPFDPDPVLRGCDDWDLWLRLAQDHPFSFQDRVALRYRFHAGNASHDVLQMHRSTLGVFRKHRKRVASGRHARLWADAFRKGKEWSAHDLLSRSQMLYIQSGRECDPAPANTALRLLRFLARSQPSYCLRPAYLARVARLLRNAVRFRLRPKISALRDTS
ncbi:MAG: glycosyltransferase family 2 protein [Akkermansiaceae bacterium]|nr:glycosyltransferase family 2 protein [Armatimonadota bacterium]